MSERMFRAVMIYCFSVVLGMLMYPVGSFAQTASISFVQSNYSVPQAPQSTVAATFPNAQSSGDLNVVMIGWNDSSAAITSVTDSKGNSYARAVGPTNTIERD